MARRVTLSDGGRPLSELYAELAQTPTALDFEALALRAATALSSPSPYIVEADFLTGRYLDEARSAAPRHVDDDAPPPPPLCPVVARLDALRAALAAATGKPLLPSAEIEILCYRPGGSYRRHVDDGPTIQLPGKGVRRSISLLLYLTSDDWADSDGGELRIHGDAGGYMDVLPKAGTLVLFDSATVAHEVLPTKRPRVLLAGWLQQAR